MLAVLTKETFKKAKYRRTLNANSFQYTLLWIKTHVFRQSSATTCPLYLFWGDEIQVVFPWGTERSIIAQNLLLDCSINWCSKLLLKEILCNRLLTKGYPAWQQLERVLTMTGSISQQVQVASSRLTQPSILPRSVKWVTSSLGRSCCFIIML